MNGAARGEWGDAGDPNFYNEWANDGPGGSRVAEPAVLNDHYKYGAALETSVCDTCLQRTTYRGGFHCPQCQHGKTHTIQKLGFYGSPIGLQLHRHSKHFTLFTEESWKDEQLPYGAMRVVGAHYALHIPEVLIVYPFPTNDKRLVDMAVAKLERHKHLLFYPPATIDRRRVADIIFDRLPKP